MQKQRSYIMDCLLTEINFLNDRYFLMIFKTPEKLFDIQPGQFVQVQVEGSPTTFLRRPISICNIIGQNELWLLVQIAGDGTKKLSECMKGDIINMILPLGKGFSTPKPSENVLLIGGGVGVAPLLLMGKQIFESGNQVSFLLGARTKVHLVLLEEFKKYGKVYLTTEDDSAGEKGYVTNHSILANESIDRIYTCGPKPMMQSITRFAKENDIECEVSLENLMACGIGACLCCVEDTVNGHVCACTEGPVFNSKLLKW